MVKKMPDKCNGGGEYSLKEVQWRLDDLKELMNEKLEAMQTMVDERDRLYKERSEQNTKFTDLGLQNLSHQMKDQFIASSRAVDKAELAQKEYNIRSNEFRAALDDAQKAMLSRSEAKSEFERTGERFDLMKEEIMSLRDFQNKSQGKSAGMSTLTAVTISCIGVIGTIIGIISLLSRSLKP